MNQRGASPRGVAFALLLALGLILMSRAADAGPHRRAARQPVTRASEEEATTPRAASPVAVNAPLISIALTQNLNFGKLVSGATAGTVTLSPAGVRSAAGGTTLANGGAASTATFTVTALPLVGYSIVLPGSATLTSAGHTMTVDTFLSNPGGTGQTGLGGTQTLRIGAKLHVGAIQASGSYTGTFNVMVTVP